VCLPQLFAAKNRRKQQQQQLMKYCESRDDVIPTTGLSGAAHESENEDADDENK